MYQHSLPDQRDKIHDTLDTPANTIDSIRQCNALIAVGLGLTVPSLMKGIATPAIFCLEPATICR